MQPTASANANSITSRPAPPQSRRPWIEQPQSRRPATLVTDNLSLGNDLAQNIITNKYYQDKFLLTLPNPAPRAQPRPRGFWHPVRKARFTHLDGGSGPRSVQKARIAHRTSGPGPHGVRKARFTHRWCGSV